MIPVDVFAGRTVAVLGLARSGITAGVALQSGGADVVAWDDKEMARDAALAAGLCVKPILDLDWTRIAALILSPGVPLTHPKPHPAVLAAQAGGAEVIGDVELFFRSVRPGEEAQRGAKIVCVTGTNGKSTTTALIGHLLSRQGFHVEVGGNIGRGCLDLAPPVAHRAYVLEMSSFQLDLTPSVRPHVAVLINISPDHLDRHGTMERYAAVKETIFRNLGRADHAVIGVDDPHSAAICTRQLAQSQAQVTAVSVGKVLGRGVYVVDGQLYDGSGIATRTLRTLKDIPSLPGAHNWQNAAMAYAAARPLVRDAAAMAAAITSFPGLEHRMEAVGQIGRVRFINDSKATNADSTARALACHTGVFWIAGGKPKSGGIESLMPMMDRVCHAYLIGEAAEAFANTLERHRPATITHTLEAAAKAALADALASGVEAPVVLLSPACASFDQFRDFEHRGQEFKRIVAELATEARLKGAA